MRESVEDRHTRILRLVRERESVRVTELAAALGISVETARRDVTALADVGRVRRLHGSVAWPTAPLNARDARLARQAPTPSPSGPVLGMVVPTANYFYRSVIRGAREAATAAGARLLVGTTDYHPDQYATRIRSMVAAGADGLLLTPCWAIDGPTERDAAQLAEGRVPTVLVERQIPLGLPGADLDRVASDHAGGAALAVHHLAGLGHQRIALLSRSTHTWPHIRRGYHAAVDALGLSDDDITLTEPHIGYFDAFERLADLLLELLWSEGVRAAIVHTDIDATNLLQRLLAQAIHIPRDFALVCYNDELAGLTDTPLTAVSPANHAVGETAVKLLLRRLEDPEVQRSTIEWLPKLVIRQSCGASPTAT
ncbi:substrate-binding domain-containing protein [Streptomyces sp. FIT100]|uniref:substrate-binding domain-containing protein n=1 Tax=Streptomyces sp. FIT100 TaxID=2837956 RepID=UPI0021C996E1|nr:substrate-binding domain-containing protein [Streptomyces sp. FIT100]UUN30764.1 substrate-binding domain-containing protein [Streptomyces sp. FIT100]